MILNPSGRPVAYVCSPYAPRDGETVDQHLLWARALARLAWDDGYWPVAPHLYLTQILTDADPAERAAGLTIGLALVRQAVVLYAYPVDNPSAGMMQELTLAHGLDIPVRPVLYADLAEAAGRLPGAPALISLPAPRSVSA